MPPGPGALGPASTLARARPGSVSSGRRPKRMATRLTQPAPPTAAARRSPLPVVRRASAPRRAGARSRRKRSSERPKTAAPRTGEHEQREPESVERRALDPDAARDADEVGQRQHVGQPAHAGRHRVHRKGEAREQDLRDDRHHAELHRLPLGLRHRRDEHARAQGDEQEEAGAEGEDEHRPRERHVEQPHAGGDDQDHVDRRHEQVGSDLADEHVARPERHHGELLHRAGLTLADHAQRGGEGADEDEDEPGDGRAP